MARRLHTPSEREANTDIPTAKPLGGYKGMGDSVRLCSSVDSFKWEIGRKTCTTWFRFMSAYVSGTGTTQKFISVSLMNSTVSAPPIPTDEADTPLVSQMRSSHTHFTDRKCQGANETFLWKCFKMLRYTQRKQGEMLWQTQET